MLIYVCVLSFDFSKMWGLWDDPHSVHIPSFWNPLSISAKWVDLNLYISCVQCVRHGCAKAYGLDCWLMHPKHFTLLWHFIWLVKLWHALNCKSVCLGLLGPNSVIVQLALKEEQKSDLASCQSIHSRISFAWRLFLKVNHYSLICREANCICSGALWAIFKLLMLFLNPKALKLHVFIVSYGLLFVAYSFLEKTFRGFQNLVWKWRYNVVVAEIQVSVSGDWSNSSGIVDKASGS